MSMRAAVLLRFLCAAAVLRALAAPSLSTQPKSVTVSLAARWPVRAAALVPL